FALQNAWRQGCQQGGAVRKLDSLAQITSRLGLEDQFLNEVLLKAEVRRTRWGIGNQERQFFGDHQGGVFGTFVGTGAFGSLALAILRRRLWGWFFETTGFDFGAWLLAFEEGNLVVKELNGLLELLNAQLLGINDGEQSFDERSSFGIRNEGKLN